MSVTIVISLRTSRSGVQNAVTIVIQLQNFKEWRSKFQKRTTGIYRTSSHGAQSSKSSTLNLIRSVMGGLGADPRD